MKELVLLLYVLFMSIAFFISYRYARWMIKTTKQFAVNMLVAVAINFLLGVIAITGWSVVSWGVNEFLFFGGLLAGVIMLLVSEISLLAMLLAKRKGLMPSSE